MQETIRKRNKKTVIALSIITALSLVCCITLIIAASNVPDSPEFCARCHSMEPYYNTWKETVACNTGCLDCHTHDNSGKTLSVEIADNNCTKSNCHPVEKLNSKASIYNDKFSFKHETHLNEFATNLKMQCAGCHSYLGKNMQEGAQNKHFGIDMNACYICHFTKTNTPLLAAEDKKDTDDCSLCHKDVQVKVKIYEKEFDHLKYEKDLEIECANCHFETVHANNGIDKNSCYYCHKKAPKEYTGADRMHIDHVKEHKTPCSPCHKDFRHEWGDEYISRIVPTRDAAVQDKYLKRIKSVDKDTEPGVKASNLKDGVRVFEDEPYLLQKEIYRGAGGIGVGETPDPMYLATVNCTACHKDKNLSVSPSICNTCHEKGFDKTMAEQKEYVTNMLNALSELLEKSQKQGIPKQLIDEARHNYDIIETDGSYGAHNIKYVKDLFTYSINGLNSKQ